jgi:hypothetical protein
MYSYIQTHVFKLTQGKEQDSGDLSVCRQYK